MSLYVPTVRAAFVVVDPALEDTNLTVTSSPLFIVPAKEVKLPTLQILYSPQTILIVAGAFIPVIVIVSEIYCVLSEASVTSLNEKESGVVSPTHVVILNKSFSDPIVSVVEVEDTQLDGASNLTLTTSPLFTVPADVVYDHPLILYSQPPHDILTAIGTLIPETVTGSETYVLSIRAFVISEIVKLSGVESAGIVVTEYVSATPPIVRVASTVFDGEACEVTRTEMVSPLFTVPAEAV